MAKIVVITGAGAGVGRAAANEFARHGCELHHLPPRHQRRPSKAVGPARPALAAPRPPAPDAAHRARARPRAARVEHELGPIDVWVNVAMATVFAPVHELTADGIAVTFHPRRQIWVGIPTLKAIIGNRMAPGLLDRYLGKSGYEGQLTDEPCDAQAPGNLFEPVSGPYAAQGCFDAQASTRSGWILTSRQRAAALGTLFGLGLVVGVHRLAKRWDL